MIPHPGGAYCVTSKAIVSGTCTVCREHVVGELGMRPVKSEDSPALEIAACNEAAAHPLGVIRLDELPGVIAMKIERPKIDPTGRN